MNLKHFIQKEPVLSAASILAFISLFFVPPDAAYLQYIDFKTLFCLLCLMISLKGIEREGLLKAISIILAARVKSLRGLTFLLVYLCFITAMIMTNDVALIALVPITLTVLRFCGLEKQAAFIIVLQTLAANIGSSLTPIGNPQNLYLFMRYHFTIRDFLATTLPFVLFSGGLLAAVCFFAPHQPIVAKPASVPLIRKQPTLVYSILFLIAIAAVFGLLPGWTATFLVVAATVLMDKDTLAEVDYNLLLTFVVIFIFVGNLARIDWIYALISGWTQQDTMLTAIVTSQFISNVPAAIMLSGFTGNADQLLVGVNVGGLGTLIASMASVISYKLYAASNQKVSRYLGIFTALNMLFLIVSTFFVKFLIFS